MAEAAGAVTARGPHGIRTKDEYTKVLEACWDKEHGAAVKIVLDKLEALAWRLQTSAQLQGSLTIDGDDVAVEELHRALTRFKQQYGCSIWYRHLHTQQYIDYQERHHLWQEVQQPLTHKHKPLLHQAVVPMSMEMEPRPPIVQTQWKIVISFCSESSFLSLYHHAAEHLQVQQLREFSKPEMVNMRQFDPTKSLIGFVHLVHHVYMPDGTGVSSGALLCSPLPSDRDDGSSS